MYRVRCASATCLLALAAGAGWAATYHVDMPNDDPTATGCLVMVSDDCSLRGAVLRANSNPGVDTIQLGGPAEYFLTIVGDNEDAAQSGDLDLLDDVFVAGRGAGITKVWQVAGDRVFDVHEGVVAFFQRLSILGGEESGGGGGAIRNLGVVTILQRTVVEANETLGSGGGIHTQSSSLWLQQSQVGGNHATGSGGGLSFSGSSSALTLEESTVGGNTAGSYGGGIAAANTTAVLRNCTINGNRSTAGVDPIDGVSLVNSNFTFESCTLADADAPLLDLLLSSTVTLRATLIDGTCAYYDPGTSAIVPDRGNLESPGDTCNLDDVTDLKNVPDPMLSVAHNHGGLAWTLRPDPASPAVDYPYATQRCQPFDERGISRPRDAGPVGTAHCDVGAVELVRDELFIDGFDGGTWIGWTAVAVP